MRKGLLIGVVVAGLLCASWINGHSASETAEKALSSAARWHEKLFSPWCKNTVLPWCERVIIPAVQRAIDSLPGTIIKAEDSYGQNKAGQGRQPTKAQQAPPAAPNQVELTQALKEQACFRMLELVNTERAKVGAKPLQYHKGAERVAILRGEDMVKRNYFGHIRPGETLADELTDKGMTCGAILRREGIHDDFGTSGENCTGGSKVLPGFIEKAHENLMNSPSHRAAILNPDFTHVGIGIVKGCGNNQGPGFPDGYTVVQIFLGQPKAKE